MKPTSRIAVSNLPRMVCPPRWVLYTPKRIKGDFDLQLDTTDFKEGTQSLKLALRQSFARTRGLGAPGITCGRPAQPGERYAVSFWIKNSGSAVVVRIGGVSAFGGQDGPKLESTETFPWRRFEYQYTIPEGMNRLRFEMNAFRPGNLWIDDVRIEKLSGVTSRCP